MNYEYKYHKYKHKYKQLKKHNIMNDDINTIVKIAQNKKIIGMGEATHGQNKITKFRIKVFKELVKNAGYTVFVLEEQYSCCELINNYIQTGEGIPKNILQYFGIPWQSTHMLNLIEWMKQYNIKNNNKLEFKGIDVHYICKGYNKKDKISNFAKKISSKM